MQEKSNRPDWHALFEQALTQPGIISKAYSVFYEYSIGNAFLAASQLVARNLPIAPLATFKKWKELGRMVKKGEKAVAMVMPVTVKFKSKDEDATDGDNEIQVKNDGETAERTIFILKNNWFSLGQTEGAEYAHEVVIPTWDKATALSSLGITEQPFAMTNGNVQGYAMPTEKILAVNQLAAMPWETLFHEMAHCLLHAESAHLADHELTPKDIKEAEAESVAFLCCASLELPGLDESRGYIQGWLGSPERSEEFKKRSASRVFSAANKILKAGCVKEGVAA